MYRVHFYLDGEFMFYKEMNDLPQVDDHVKFSDKKVREGIVSERVWRTDDKENMTLRVDILTYELQDGLTGEKKK